MSPIPQDYIEEENIFKQQLRLQSREKLNHGISLRGY